MLEYWGKEGEYELRKVYLDNAATTMVSGEVLNAMLPYFTQVYGNGNSLHQFGRMASNGIDQARDIIAQALHCNNNEVFFTSGGTEANNWAIRGIAYANQRKGRHIIVSAIEHHSIIDTCQDLENEGFDVTYLKVDKTGLVSLIDLMQALREDTILVSIMAVNNEVGTIQNIRAIGETLKDYNAYFHCDAVQAFGIMPFDVQHLGIDALTISSHKIHGPKGAGALYVRRGVPIKKLIFGGEQELGRRGGTSNVPAIVGFGKAVELIERDRPMIVRTLENIAQYFKKRLQFELDDIHFNGNEDQCSPAIVSVGFEYVEGESILMLLDEKGIAVSTGSACASGALAKSHVLKAMKVDPALINGTVRFSFDPDITRDDIDYAVISIAEVVKKLRAMSPLTKKKRGGNK